MPQLTVEGRGTFHVPHGKRLVLALEEDVGLEPLHTCGGMAGCSTCRVKIVKGEPTRMTVAEKERLALHDLSDVRLSCQVLCDQDMTVTAISRFKGIPPQANKPTPDLRPLPVEWIEQ